MRKRKEYLDERQQIERGKAFQYAFFTLLIAVFICCAINGVLQKPILDYYAVMMIPMWLSFSVVYTIMIMRDALFINNKEHYAGAWLALAICWGISGAIALTFFVLDMQRRFVFQDGVLSMSFVQAFMGVCMIEICVVYLVKRIKDKRKAKAAEEPDQIAQ